MKLLTFIFFLSVLEASAQEKDLYLVFDSVDRKSNPISFNLKVMEGPSQFIEMINAKLGEKILEYPEYTVSRFYPTGNTPIVESDLTGAPVIPAIRIAFKGESGFLEMKKTMFKIPRPPGPAPVNLLDCAKTMRQMDGLTFKEIDLKNKTIEEVCDFLSSKSREIDPLQEGVKFNIGRQGDSIGWRFDLNLKNVTLREALRKIGGIARFDYFPNESGIDLVSNYGDRLIIRIYVVPPGFLKADRDSTPSGNFIVNSQLTSLGAQFPEGSSAVYFPNHRYLKVTHSFHEIERIDKLIFQAFVKEQNKNGGH